MKHILCYGDSISWGTVPGTRQRYPFEIRWPGVLQLNLGPHVRVIEECLSGRTTALEDPYRPGRNGLASFLPILQSHSPLDLVIILLGTNDLKSFYGGITAYHASLGILALIDVIRNNPLEPTYERPETLIVSPPIIDSLVGIMEQKYAGAGKKSRENGIGKWLKKPAAIFLMQRPVLKPAR